MKLIFLALVCLGVSTYAAVTDSPEWSDSGIHGPKYAEILKEMDAWAAAYPESTRVVEYGKSVQGKPLRLAITANRGRFTDRPTLLMTGSTHGNEYLNIEDRLPLELIKKSRMKGTTVHDFLAQGGVLIFVPILNPDGYDSRKRENAHHVDLNRDWDVPQAGFHGFKEVETRALAEKLHGYYLEGLRYKVTVDYHCCIGALLHPLSYKKAPLPEPDAASHLAFAETATKNLKIDVGTTGEILGYYPLGTTKDYYYMKYGANAFTYEGKYRTEKEYLPQHVAWWEAMLELVTQEARRPLLTLMKDKKHPFIPLAD